MSNGKLRRTEIMSNVIYVEWNIMSYGNKDERIYVMSKVINIKWNIMLKNLLISSLLIDKSK
jgi:hypothetical protein